MENGPFPRYEDDGEVFGKKEGEVQGDEWWWEWGDSSFDVVARIGRETGRMEGLYVGCNYLRADYDIRHCREGSDSWARVSREIGPFCVAGIGDKLGEMGFERYMEFGEKVEWPVEIVRVMWAGNGMGFVRERVGEPLVEGASVEGSPSLQA